ncbi:MAG: hypothetical protein CMJ23_06885 [Phycisphaerae bacterium]|nr:hypothetical protein [Phycisphaerae bacterium]
MVRARRVLAGLCSVGVLGLGGCVMPHGSAEIGVVAIDAVSGQRVEGVRIFRHGDQPGVSDTPPDAVAMTDPAGLAIFDVPRLESEWLVLRDGYEPMLVRLREGGVAADPGHFEFIAPWSEVAERGSLDLPLVPTSWKPVRLTVVDADSGAGVAGASVSVESVSFFDRETGFQLHGVPVLVTSTTDAHGVVALSVPSGTTSEVTIEASGHAGTSASFDPASPQGISSHQMVAMEAYRYEPTRIIVLDRSTGLPVEGAVLRVFLSAPDGGSICQESIWTTGDDGTVVVMKPSAGLGSIRIEHENRLPSEFNLLEIHAPEFKAIAIGAEDFE